MTILQGIAFIRITSWSDVFMLALLAVPLITVFFVLGTGITACFRQLSPASIIWRRVAALTGGILQGLLELLWFVLSSITLHTALASGFFIVLIGFSGMILGTVFDRLPRSRPIESQGLY